MYALDLMQHWHLDNDDIMADALKTTDEFFGTLVDRCSEQGTQLVLLVDHGQEPVVGTIPLMHMLKASRVPRREYTFFVELASARFWFHSDRARRAILPKLQAIPETSLFDWKSMHQFGVCFEDDTFGEYYLMADASRIFFPHDFYQPIGNAFLGAMDRHQRQRLFNPVHRGNHGYLPHFPSEQGWIMPVDLPLSATSTSGHVIDVAPTLLALLDVQPPEHMTGRVLFKP
jgi:arylsulfatase A-like enzyme